MQDAGANYQVPTERLARVLRAATTASIDESEHQRCKEMYYGGRRAVEPRLRRWRREKGITGREVDLFQMHINAVLGAEAQRQVDWVSTANNDEGSEVAEATNVLINDMARLHDVNHHCSEAYKWQIINGLGWLYFGRNPNPAAGKRYEVESVGSTEILWDRRCRRLDLEDCDWLARRRYLARDQAEGMFPEHKALIKQTFSTRGGWGPIHGSMGMGLLSGAHYLEGLGSSRNLYRAGMSIHDDEVAVFDLYYRVTEMRTHIVLPGHDMPVEYDPQDSEHVEALFSGHVTPFRAPVRAMRNAWFIGPYLVDDGPSPHPHEMFPYVCFRGYQEEDTGAVYGLGRSLMSPINAYNDAKTQIYHLLDKITVLVGTNALAQSPYTLEEIAHEAQKPDAVLEVPENSSIEIRHHYEHIHELLAIMSQSFEEARWVSGVSSNFTGQEQSQQSGVAMQVSVDQTTKSLADMDENNQMARRQVGLIMLAHSRYEVGLQERAVPIKQDGEPVKTVRLNARDDRGRILNDFRRTRLDVVMAEIQTSAGYRAQQHAMFRESMPGAAEPMQPILAEGMIRTSNVPEADRNRMLAQLRKTYGTSPDPEQQRKMDEDAGKRAEAEAKLVERERVSEIEKTEAETRKIDIEAKAAASTIGEQLMQMADQADQESAQAAEAIDAEEAEKQELLSQMRQQIAARASVQREPLAA